MRAAQRLVAVGAALAGIAAAAAVLHAREARYPLTPAAERLLYLRSPKAADRLMLDFDALASDVYWIRAIQSYGRDLKNRTLADRFALVDPLLDLTTSLDPHFLIAYRFGAVFLAMEPPNGPGRPDLAIKLLEKGVAANPTAWQLPHDIAFVHYFHTGDFAAAATWFKRAMAIPNSPTWIPALAATTEARGGDREGARSMLVDMQRSPDAYVRRAAQRTLEQLDVLDAIDLLTGLVEDFNRKFGHYPADWPEMLRLRVLGMIPVDKYNAAFVYDPATHAVRLSSESPLFPLPPTLQAR
jgi:tetratricopeptide (TPR) repeat protein